MSYLTGGVILLIGAVILFVISLKFVKNILHAAMSVLGIILVAFLMFSVLFYSDATSLRENFKDDKIMAFEYEDEVIGGMEITGDGTEQLISNESEIKYFDDETLENFDRLKEENKSEFGLILVIDMSDVVNRSVTLEMENRSKELTPQEFAAVMESDSLSEVNDIVLSDDRELPYESLTVVKSLVAGSAFIQVSEDIGQGYLIDLIRSDSLRTIPEFWTIEIIKKFPAGLIG